MADSTPSITAVVSAAKELRTMRLKRLIRLMRLIRSDCQLVRLHLLCGLQGI